MNESTILTFDDVKFIGGETKLTQPNWQDYFGNALVNGVYSGLDANLNQIRSAGRYVINDGVIFVNGMMGKIETENGYTDLGWGEDIDEFYCARMNFQNGTVDLVKKTGIADTSGASTTAAKNLAYLKTLMEFEYDESYCCTRDVSVWDIPLLYRAAYSCLNKGVDLTRRHNAEKKIIYLSDSSTGGVPERLDNMSMSANNAYYFNGRYVRNAFVDTVNPPNGATLTFMGTSGYNSKIYLRRVPYVIWLNSGTGGYGIDTLDAAYEIKYIFSNPSKWTQNDMYYEFAEKSGPVSFRFTLVGCNYTQNTNCNYIFFVEDF